MKINKNFDIVKMVNEDRQKLSNEFNNMRTEEQKKPLRERTKTVKAVSSF